jgi:NADPH:quinone reductase-like Zn-dependent oxidoreductase
VIDTTLVNADALWYVGPGRAEIRRESLAAPGPGEIRIETLYSAISRGTERLVSAGRVPESEFERMRAPFMSGAFPFPVKYGYAAVGRVAQGPPEMIDRAVFALHPHQTAFNLPADACVVIPDSVPPARAALAANMETALNALWDAAPGPADRIAIVGAGIVGALVAYLCGRLPGAEVTLVDRDPSRARIAEALGVRFAAPADAAGDCDLVVHASGSAAGLASAIGLAGEEATVLEMSWYGSGEVAVPLGGAFHSQRLKIVSSQVGRIAPSHRARWTHRRRLAAALDLLKDSRLDVLLAPPVAFHAAPAGIADMLSAGGSAQCPLLVYPAE